MLIVSLASVEDQMEQAAVAYSDLLDGKDKPVVGSTCEYKEGQMWRHHRHIAIFWRSYLNFRLLGVCLGTVKV